MAEIPGSFIKSKKQVIKELKIKLKTYRTARNFEDDVSDEGNLVTQDNGQTDFQLKHNAFISSSPINQAFKFNGKSGMKATDTDMIRSNKNVKK